MPLVVGAAGQWQPLDSHLSAEGESLCPRAHLNSGVSDSKPLGQLWMLGYMPCLGNPCKGS